MDAFVLLTFVAWWVMCCAVGDLVCGFIAATPDLALRLQPWSLTSDSQLYLFVCMKIDGSVSEKCMEVGLTC
jgi:hypothetical protein